MSVIAPVDGTVITLQGEDYPAVLTMNEIMRFEQGGGKLYAFFRDLFANNQEVSMKDVISIIQLGLIGGGLPEKDAVKVINSLTPKDLIQLPYDCLKILSSALVPDESELDDDADDVKKN